MSSTADDLTTYTHSVIPLKWYRTREGARAKVEKVAYAIQQDTLMVHALLSDSSYLTMPTEEWEREWSLEREEDVPLTEERVKSWQERLIDNLEQATEIIPHNASSPYERLAAMKCQVMIEATALLVVHITNSEESK